MASAIAEVFQELLPSSFFFWNCLKWLFVSWIFTLISWIINVRTFQKQCSNTAIASAFSLWLSSRRKVLIHLHRKDKNYEDFKFLNVLFSVDVLRPVTLLYPKTLPDMKRFQNTMFVLSAIVFVHTYSWSLLNSLQKKLNK